MRNRITAILFFLLFTTASSYAAAVLTIYPQSSTPVSISTADNFTLTYTVTNTTSKANIQQITIDPYYQQVAPLLKLTLQDNTCSNITLAPGGVCTFAINIWSPLPTQAVLQPRICGYNGLVCSTPIEDNRVAITVSNPFFLAVGSNHDAQFSVPLITSSPGASELWAAASLPAVGAGFLTAAACQSGKKYAAVGGGSTQGALIFESTDSGLTWTAQTIVGSSLTGVFNGIASAAQLYIAYGTDEQTNIPILAQQVSDSAWQMVELAGDIGFNGEFIGGSCTEGDEGNTLCAVVGDGAILTFPIVQPPLLLQTRDGGANWAYVTTSPSLPANGILESVSCIPGALCVAVGQDNDHPGTQPPLLVQTVNSGVDWENIPLLDVTMTGLLKAVSCTGTLGASLCVAGGIDQISDNPLLIQSINGGPWTIVPIAGIPGNGGFNSVSCSGLGGNAVCAAGGSANGTDGSIPFVVLTSDGGASWALADLPNLTTNGGVNGVVCTGNTPTAICIVLGVDNSTGGPLQYQTNNSGGSWQNIISPAPSPSAPQTAGYPELGHFSQGAVSNSFRA